MDTLSHKFCSPFLRSRALAAGNSLAHRLAKPSLSVQERRHTSQGGVNWQNPKEQINNQWHFWVVSAIKKSDSILTIMTNFHWFFANVNVSNTPASAACLQAERLLGNVFVPSAAGSLCLPLKVDFPRAKAKSLMGSHQLLVGHHVTREKIMSLEHSTKHFPLHDPQQMESL